MIARFLRLNPYVALACVTFVVSAVGFARYPTVLPVVDVTWPVRQAGLYVPSTNPQSGPEIAVVFIGSTTCVWSNIRTLPTTIDNITLRLSRRAAHLGYGFSATGIAKSTSALEGQRYLRKFGAFDETHAGRSWLNAVLLKYVSNDFPGPANTPQLLVIARDVAKRPHYRVSSERVLVRKVGVKPIEDWLAAGTPLPQELYP